MVCLLRNSPVLSSMTVTVCSLPVASTASGVRDTEVQVVRATSAAQADLEPFVDMVVAQAAVGRGVGVHGLGFGRAAVGLDSRCSITAPIGPQFVVVLAELI